MTSSNLTTPETIGPMVNALVASIGACDPVRVEVDAQPGCRHGYCFESVSRLVEEQGGELVLGWCIWERVRVFAEAEHHAIWRRADGSLIDPVPKPDGETSILFVPDASAVWMGAGHSGLPTRRRANRLNRDAEAWVKCADEADRLLRPYRRPGAFQYPPEVHQQLVRLAKKQSLLEGRLVRRGL